MAAETDAAYDMQAKRLLGHKVQIIINVEAQKDEPKTYNILNRAIFYVCRLVSSQKDRDFVKMNYNDIKKVYSIWVCLGMEECVLDRVHLQKDTLLNEYQWKGDLDLLNIVMVGLPKKLPAREEKYSVKSCSGQPFFVTLVSAIFGLFSALMRTFFAH